MSLIQVHATLHLTLCIGLEKESQLIYKRMQYYLLVYMYCIFSCRMHKAKGTILTQVKQTIRPSMITDGLTCLVA